MDMKLELVILPVTDVDRAKAFYEQAGFHLDVDHQAGEEFRVVQLTPPGSACSITIGQGMTDATPGLGTGPAPRRDATSRPPGPSCVGTGASTSASCSTSDREGQTPGVDPERRDFGSFATFK